MISTYVADITPLYKRTLYETLFEDLSEQRKEKCRRFIAERDRCLSMGTELILRFALKERGLDESEARAKIAGIRYCCYGKPDFGAFSEVHFNLAHSGTLAVCTLADAPVGVDVECLSEIDLMLAEHYFCRSENRYLLSFADETERRTAFFRLWTLKESYMKATGAGFSVGLDQFEIRMGEKVAVRHELNDKTYHFKEYPLVCGSESYRMSVCCETDDFAPELRWVTLGV